MLYYPKIDPVALAIGPFKLRWYGLMYIFAFLAGWLFGRYRASRQGSGWTTDQVDDLATWVMLGVIVGARLGYVFFYDFSVYREDPLEILRVWNGGMSFHGGLLGVLLVCLWWAFRHKKRFLEVTDFLAPLTPFGLLCGRLGNFINGELWGKTTTMPWGAVFSSGGPAVRHPTQLYEAGLEGMALLVILLIFSSKPRPLGAISGVFAVCYALFRIFVEFFRLPDVQLGYIYLGWVTMGQLLCLPLLLLGIIMLLYANKEKHNPSRDRVILEDGSVVWIKRR